MKKERTHINVMVIWFDHHVRCRLNYTHCKERERERERARARAREQERERARARERETETETERERERSSCRLTAESYMYVGRMIHLCTYQ